MAMQSSQPEPLWGAPSSPAKASWSWRPTQPFLRAAARARPPCSGRIPMAPQPTAGDAHSWEGVSLGLGGTLRGGVDTLKCSSGPHRGAGKRYFWGQGSKDGNRTLTGDLLGGAKSWLAQALTLSFPVVLLLPGIAPQQSNCTWKCYCETSYLQPLNSFSFAVTTDYTYKCLKTKFPAW